MNDLVCPIEDDCRAYGPDDTFCREHLIDLVPSSGRRTGPEPPRQARPAADCWRCRTPLAAAADLCPVCQASQPGPPFALIFEGGESIEVERGRAVRLGRHTHPPLRATNISRDHAAIGLDDDGAWVADHRSLNGTWVNGSDLGAGGRGRLQDGDKVGLGNNPPARVMLRSTP